MRKLLYILILALPVMIMGCMSSQKEYTFVNTSHLDDLYEEVEMNGTKVGIIHIYSNYPDYKWVGDSDEGIACIDDVARATIVYLNKYRFLNDEESLRKVGNLVGFILNMQAENGFFYNFLFDDMTINKTHKNSLPQANWWTWRAMWALMESYNVYKNIDVDFANKILKSVDASFDAMKRTVPLNKKVDVVNGFSIPTWLPWESAADQAAVLLQSLVPYYEVTKDESVLDYIKSMQKGICLMQIQDNQLNVYGAFKSWRNMWHAYGNIQSYSLLLSSQTTDDKIIVESALREINNFYKMLLNEKYFSNFSLRLEDTIVTVEINKFSQIAYNIRPMVYACLEAYKITSDSLYAVQAADIASWFFMNNPADAQMYFLGTGIGYDGINSEDEINKNSGAESTIEALLTLQAIESNPIAKEKLLDFYNQHIR